jgi:ABC-2 type transport system ATP-binding protein
MALSESRDRRASPEALIRPPLVPARVEPAIEVRGLTKTFEKRKERGWRGWGKPRERTTALAGVDLEVRRGELFGLLGPNAAGKTTLVKVLSTLLLPTGGGARVLGLDVATQGDAVRRQVGVVLGGERALYWRLTGRENLWYFSQLYNMPRAQALPRIEAQLELVGLADRADERVETYSKGMKQRLHIARGLLNDPEVLLLDEPTIGLDPQAARTLRALVRRVVAEQGKTVVLTTHYMYEADEIAERVAILHRGRIVACDTPAALKARHAEGGAYRVTVRASEDGRVRAALAAMPGARIVAEQPEDGGTTYRLVAAEGAPAGLASALARAVLDAKGQLLGLQQEQPTLEDVFVRLTGEALDPRGPQLG